MKKELSNNTKLWLLLAAILLIGGVAFAILTWLLMILKWWFILLFAGYFTLVLASDLIVKNMNNSFTRILNKVVSTPLIIIYFLFGIAKPFITIIGSYLFVFLFAFGAPALILVFCSKTGWVEMKPEAIAFIVIAMGSILCSTFYSFTKWIIHWTPLRDWGEHKYESYREELAVFLIHPNNVVFLIYLLYFLYLVVSGFIQIQKGSFLISQNMDAAILKAFLVFIAYTNIRIKAKQTDIVVEDLLRRTLLLFVRDKES